MYFARSAMTGFTLATSRICEHDCDSTQKEIHSRPQTAVAGSWSITKLIWSRLMQVARGIWRAAPVDVSFNRNSRTTSENIPRKKRRERSGAGRSKLLRDVYARPQPTGPPGCAARWI